MPELWPHQVRGIEAVKAAIRKGRRRILLTIPTGGGKTRVACELIEWTMQLGGRAILYTNRKLLVEQISQVMAKAGLEHGIRSAGYAVARDCPLQVSSIQTEGSRVLRKKRWTLHKADTVVVDEAHLMSGKTAKTIMGAHLEDVGTVIGLTATPLDLGDIYEELIVAGTPSELRRCGALVACEHYGPDEPDLARFRKLQLGMDLSAEDQARAMGPRPQLWGRVWKHYQRLNSEGCPTILFAPGVPESVWFAEQFTKHCVVAAHIDGKEIWLKGKFERTSREAREEVLAAFRAGEIKVLCNRFVLREGLDLPEAAHGILATPFGSLQSYLQAGGRLLRANLGKGAAVIQDHGGNWWRHGSLNADREWHLEDTARFVAAVREERLRSKKCRRCRASMIPGNPWCPDCSFYNEIEPTRCPECDLILICGRCIKCGYEIQPVVKSRAVVTVDGSLKLMTGDIYKPRVLCRRPDGPSLWKRMYHRGRSKKWDATFRQCEAMYAYENGWRWPDRSWPLMPLDPDDFARKVRDVPVERLIEEQAHATTA